VVQKVKLTGAERDQLRARAAELGVSVPRLLVESALAEGTVTGTERRAEMVELFEVRRLLATVANNVNQLARLANISGEVPAGRRLENAVEDVEEIVGRLRLLTGARR
jgi:Bacterial mobilisation protein (MobC)